MLQSEARPIVHDPAFAAAPALLGEAGREMVRAVLADDGAQLRHLRNDFVLYTPGRGITVTYVGSLTSGQSEPVPATVVAYCRRDRPPPEGCSQVELEGWPVGVWLFPADPFLPGLRVAADPLRVSEVLRMVGLPKGRVQLRLRAYRPGVRAVIEAKISRPTLLYESCTRRFRSATALEVVYLKVLRPGQAAALASRHDALAEPLPAPRCLAHHDELGILVLEAVPGYTLGTWLTHHSRGPGDPPAEQLLGLLERLADRASTGGSAVPAVTVAEQVRSHVRLLRSLMPEEAERIDRLGAEFQRTTPQPQVWVHGDFYDSQVLVEDGRVAGILDLDDVGPGERADDLATMAGRVWTLAETHHETATRRRLRGYALALLDSFSRVVEPSELDRRVGGILLGRATGPFRTQEPAWREECARRIRLAEAWWEQRRMPGAGT